MRSKAPVFYWRQQGVAGYSDGQLEEYFASARRHVSLKQRQPKRRSQRGSGLYSINNKLHFFPEECQRATPFLL